VEAMQVFERMKADGLKPNNVTYTTLVSGCVKYGKEDNLDHLFTKSELNRFA